MTYRIQALNLKTGISIDAIVPGADVRGAMRSFLQGHPDSRIVSAVLQ